MRSVEPCICDWGHSWGDEGFKLIYCQGLWDVSDKHLSPAGAATQAKGQNWGVVLLSAAAGAAAVLVAAAFY